MKTALTESQIDSYHKNGFLAVENFLNSQELEKLCEDVARGVKQIGSRRVGGDVNKEFDSDGTSYYDQVFLQKVNLWKFSDAIKEFFLNPSLGKMLCELADTDGMRIWHDQTLQKKPWGNPTAWHLDNPYWSFYSHQSISIWIALDDVILQNGCLYYLPGSHKIARYDNVNIGQNMADLFEFYPEFNDIEAVPIEMKAGSCGFHNGLTAHAAGPNMTPYWRRAMTCAYMPDGSTFNGQQNILSAEQFRKLTVGDLMDNENQNPLVWSKEMDVAK
jgi:phytanoyl-CoA hydroxylase